VGSPVDVRPRHAARAIGYHVNVLPLRARGTRGDTVRGFVRGVREVYFGALAHSDVPVDELTGLVPRSGSSWRNMLFRHLFNYVPRAALADTTFAGGPAERLAVENGYSKFDLEFFVVSAPDELRVRAVFCSELLDPEDVELLLARYEELLLAMAGAPDAPVDGLDVWSARDRQVIEEANDTGTASGSASVLAAFAEHARSRPDAPALVSGERSISYRDLHAAASAVSDQLRAADVRPGDTVAVAARRGPELAAAVLGTWLTGAAYLPLDPEHPRQRIAHQLSDSGAAAVLTGPDVTLPVDSDRPVLHVESTAQARPDHRIGEVPAVDTASPAYLIYTSGSTGLPKGTIVSHRSLANVVNHFAAELRTGPGDHVLWSTTFSFDISALELYVPLTVGGTAVGAPDMARTDGRVLRDLLERHEVRAVQATPTTWRLVLEEAGPALRGRRVLCGGEPAPLPLVEALLATGCTLHHVYGPTETTIWSTSAVFDALDGRAPGVGRPIAATRALVTSPEGRALPIGVRGELRLAGDGVAIGYHGRPELNAERFGTHPRYGRYYHTGDLARWRADGTLELLGRSDRQVKLRGNRIELPEIEAVLLALPEVRASAVVVVGDPAADAVLVAFVEAPLDAVDLSDRLWEHARTSLPRAMVPQEFVTVEALPANLNGKVDYPALVRAAEEHRAAVPAAAAVPAPEDGLVADLVALWRRLLKRDDVSSETNFFTHGGQSLLGALLVQEIESHTGVRLALADLFDNPTPTSLARCVRAADDSAGEQFRKVRDERG
jgi:amino acid adenylation domain-containing protein